MNPANRTRMNKNEVLNQVKIAVMGYPMKAMADDIGKPYSTLSNELDHRGTSKLGFLDVLSILERSLGPTTTDQSRLAALAAVDLIEEGMGRVAFELPEAVPTNPIPLLNMLSKLSREFSEAVKEIAAAIADGEVTQKESKQCRAEMKDLVTVCLQVDAYFKKMWGA